jgi:hypothetical protein
MKENQGISRILQKLKYKCFSELFTRFIGTVAVYLWGEREQRGTLSCKTIDMLPNRQLPLILPARVRESEHAIRNFDDLIRLNIFGFSGVQAVQELLSDAKKECYEPE